MIPMRDGVHLQTVIITPANQAGPLPILLRRTPYGVSDDAEKSLEGPAFHELLQDGYIFVMQNLRGRFKSEGTFNLSSFIDLSDPKATNETTDAYDTIDWLVKNVPNNNGRVGIYGVSYSGLTAGLTLLHPHPALKAVSEQASPADQWMNDDMHRYGALRESYAVEYSVMEQADKNANTPFNFDTYDTYEWYLQLGPLSNVNAKYTHNSIPYWNDIMQHPNRDEFWKREAWVDQLHSASVPTLNVAGWWDQEDPWGPWDIYRKEGPASSGNYMVAGPWVHGSWDYMPGDKLGVVTFGNHQTSIEYHEKIEAPFFRYYLHGQGAAPTWKAQTFRTGSNSWQAYDAWPPKNTKPTNVYLHCDGTLSFDAPRGGECKDGFVQYVSDPAKPVPYRTRPISPTYPAGDWPTWEIADQRFVEGRPDVLSFVSAPLDHDITVTGEFAADLFASTSGTDSDFVVKLIDVYPQTAQADEWKHDQGPKPGEYAQSLNGYELPIAMEVRRGRFNKSFESPQPLVPNQATEFQIPLRDHDHVFLKGHRIMVQVQSTWFPVIDRNPQKFVKSIYDASAADYVSATQRVYCTPQQASRIVLPVMQ